MPARKPAVKAKPKSGLPSWLVVAAIVVVAVVAVVIAADLMTKLQPTSTGSGSSDVAASGRTQGDPNAPVSFIEYSDFQ
ncbi:MAG: DsbA family protein [Chloroflexi bacterium]|nr:DsbA family protein [Chloroflexota bacterium]